MGGEYLSLTFSDNEIGLVESESFAKENFGNPRCIKYWQSITNHPNSHR
jgi:hypothetical protein